MATTRRRRSGAPREVYDPTSSADDPGAQPTERLLDLLLQISLDARHTALDFVLDGAEGGRVTAAAADGPRVLLRAPTESLQAFVDRLKDLADLPPEHGTPAEGVIQVRHGGAPIVLRLRTSGGPEGERVHLEFDWPAEEPPPAPA